MSYHFFVPGIPVAQPRVKARRQGRFVRIYTPGQADAWKDCVRKVGLQHKPGSLLTGPLHVRLLFAMPRPKHLSTRSYKDEIHRPHFVKPDIDNLAKAVLDAMSDWWKDDCQVTMLTASKWYARVGGATGVEVHVTEMQVPGDPCRSRKDRATPWSLQTSKV